MPLFEGPTCGSWNANGITGTVPPWTEVFTTEHWNSLAHWSDIIFKYWNFYIVLIVHIIEIICNNVINILINHNSEMSNISLSEFTLSDIKAVHTMCCVNIIWIKHVKHYTTIHEHIWEFYIMCRHCMLHWGLSVFENLQV